MKKSVVLGNTGRSPVGLGAMRKAGTPVFSTQMPIAAGGRR